VSFFFLPFRFFASIAVNPPFSVIGTPFYFSAAVVASSFAPHRLPFPFALPVKLSFLERGFKEACGSIAAFPLLFWL